VRDPATIAAQLANSINGGMISKGAGASVTIETTYPAALLLADVEARIDAAGRDLAEMSGALGALSQPDFLSSARLTGAADGPLDAAEAERVSRITETFEREIWE
jgi:hypothetical protein